MDIETEIVIIKYMKENKQLSTEVSGGYFCHLLLILCLRTFYLNLFDLKDKTKSQISQKVVWLI